MAYSIGQIKSDIVATLHGTTLNQITGINALISRAGRKLLNDIDPIETMRKVELSTPLYGQVFDYACPEDLKDERIIDVFPQVKRKLRDRFFQRYAEEFDLYKELTIGEGNVSVEWNTYTKYLRIQKELPQPILINPATQIVGTGTWATGGTATTLVQDNLNYVFAPSSLRFTLSAGSNPSTGYIENSTFQAIDLTREDNEGIVMTYVYFDTPEDITSVEMRWGSSSANYYAQSVNTDFFGNSFAIGWNLLKFEWLSATTVGTPDPAQITYLRVSFTYNGTLQSNIRVNSITSQLGVIYLMKYYSKFLYRDSITGAFKEMFTTDADFINLDITSYNIFINLCAYFAVQQQASNNGPFDAQFFLNEYEKEKDRYVKKIRSQTIKPQGQYYKMPPKRQSYVRFNS
jgi:hypothetical protein